jgi:hypothetical protein
MLQVVKHDGWQATFVFVNPNMDRPAILEQRELVKETLQQALVANRQMMNEVYANIDFYLYCILYKFINCSLCLFNFYI